MWRGGYLYCCEEDVGEEMLIDVPILMVKRCTVGVSSVSLNEIDYPSPVAWKVREVSGELEVSGVCI